jgi:diacylglycerol kinase (ATP)
MDAQIALQFHHSREANPGFFKSRTINKGVYGVYGVQKLIDAPPILGKFGLTVSHEGESLSEEVVSRLQCLIWMNIPSYGGGVSLWGAPSEKSDFVACQVNDGIVEVVGLRHIRHALGLQTKIQSGTKVCQGKSFHLVTTLESPIQVSSAFLCQRLGSFRF